MRGVILGWDDVDLKAGTAAVVSRAPNSKSSAATPSPVTATTDTTTTTNACDAYKGKTKLIVMYTTFYFKL